MTTLNGHAVATPAPDAASPELRAKRLPIEAAADRLWHRVDRSGGPDACWPFLGPRVRGYGRASFGDRVMNAHRIAWIVTHGPLASSRVVVCHRCDNPPCCNPTHLFVGTQKDNMRDMRQKGRGARLCGEDSPSRRRPECRPSKLTLDQAVAILQRARTGRESDAAIAREFSIATAQVRRIRIGQAWRRAWATA